MKEEILRLRKQGYSYCEIENELKCSRSTISYHCKRNNLNTPNCHPNKLNDEIISEIKLSKLNNTVKNISEILNISESSVIKYSSGVKKTNIKNSKKIICIECGKETNYKYNKQFCSIKCNALHKHKMAYFDFINNNDKYCVGNYTAKSFKDFFLEEQNNKCAICGIEPIWNNSKIVFVLDHIDGDASNNKRKNLRLICPNCDSQTNTFKSKNKNSKRRNYWKEKIIKNKD